MKTPGQKFSARVPWFAAATLAALLSAGVLYSATRVHRDAAQDKETRPSSPDQATSLGDQTDLAVTVYNSNIALVRDVRQLTLPSGYFRLKFMDIAATVNPPPVHFRSLTEPETLGVIEQNYQYDLLEPPKLLHKYCPKAITLERSYFENNTTKHEQFKATLLADNNGTVWKVGNDIITNLAVESYHFPEVPANLYARPTLLMSM